MLATSDPMPSSGRTCVLATHSGIRLAPLVGRLATREITDHPVRELAEFRPDRFRHGQRANPSTVNSRVRRCRSGRSGRSPDGRADGAGVEHRDPLAGSRAQRFGPPTGVEHGDVRRNYVSAGEGQPHAAAGYLEVGDIGGAAQHDTVVDGIAPEPCLQEVLVQSFIGKVGDVSEMRGSRSSAGARSPDVQTPFSLGNHVRTVFSTFELSRARPASSLGHARLPVRQSHCGQVPGSVASRPCPPH